MASRGIPNGKKVLTDIHGEQTNTKHTHLPLANGPLQLTPEGLYLTQLRRQLRILPEIEYFEIKVQYDTRVLPVK